MPPEASQRHSRTDGTRRHQPNATSSPSIAKNDD
jgi:hypothetical protein